MNRYRIIKLNKTLRDNLNKSMPCSGFGGPCYRKDAKLRRQNTNYTDEEKNWAILCDDCQKAADSYWESMWREYYSGCL